MSARTSHDKINAQRAGAASERLPYHNPYDAATAERDRAFASLAYDHAASLVRQSAASGGKPSERLRLMLSFCKSVKYYAARSALSTKQLDSLCKVLGVDAPPPIESRLPPATQVLPKRPPVRMVRDV